MTMTRAAKKTITWASKGEAQYVENPVARGARRRAGLSDYLTGAEFLAQARDRSGRITWSPRTDKVVAHRVANRKRGYKAK
jgi:hypothetical protein